MATTVNSDTIFNEAIAQTAFLEVMQDNLAVFNQASNGAIILRDENLVGDFSEEAFYRIGGQIEHRDVNINPDLIAKKINMGTATGVKVPFRYGPYEATEESFKRRGRNISEFSMVVGQDYANAQQEGYFKYGTTALMGALSGNADMSATAPIKTFGRKTLTQGLRKFGDKFNRVALWVMDSETYFDMVEDDITNKIYDEYDQVVYGGSPRTKNKPVLITDGLQSDLILGLQRGALTITNSQLPAMDAWKVRGKENFTMAFQAEGAFNLDIMGYSYNTQAGANPNLASLGTPANWIKYVTDNKNTAGVAIHTA